MVGRQMVVDLQLTPRSDGANRTYLGDVWSGILLLLLLLLPSVLVGSTVSFLRDRCGGDVFRVRTPGHPGCRGRPGAREEEEEEEVEVMDMQVREAEYTVLPTYSNPTRHLPH